MINKSVSQRKTTEKNKKKIRVLHCVTAMDRGGLETLIMNYYRNIDKDRYSFDFLVQRGGRFEYSDEIERLGGRVYAVRAFNPFKIKQYNCSLNGFFSEHVGDYDIIHAHNNSFAMYTLRAAKRYDYPVRISHSHIASNRFNLFRTPFVLYNKRKLKRYCNVEFACAKAAGRWLFGNDDFILIKNAIDLKIFAFNEQKRNIIRNKYMIDNDTIVLGHVGRFEKQKNHSFLIDIMKRLEINGVDAKLLLVGKGSLEGRIREKVRKLGLEEKVIFVGCVDNPNEYLNAMDVFVMPSFNEGLPVTLIEAQANGLPCVVSDKVSNECKVTPLVSFVPLSNALIDVWTEQIIKSSRKGMPRTDYCDTIKDAGFEIESAAIRLEKLYKDLLVKYDFKKVPYGGIKCS